jgi:hypothetical protein
MGDTGHIYVALGVSVDRPSATHIKATMTINPDETCSELVDRNNGQFIDVTEKLARNFLYKHDVKIHH